MDDLSWSCPNTVVIALDGMRESDDLADFRFQLHRSILDGARTIVVDVSSLATLPSALIAAMLVAHRSCRRRGGGVILRNPNQRVLGQLQRTGLAYVLQVERWPTAAALPGGDTR